MSTLRSQGLYGSTTDGETQRTAFLNGEIPVAVYGLGKMGLPLAGVYAETCGNVIGADIDPDVVETINDGGCHVKREPGLDELVADLVAEGALEATSDPVEAAKEASVHVIIVPTPITDDNEPDLSILQAAVEAIGQGLSEGDTVIVECTVPPKTTTGLVTETLEEMSGLSRGTFGVAFCPERTSSGRALEDIRSAYPKVVGGVDTESTRVAKLLYKEINSCGVLETSDATTAECVKLFEGMYRDVNIALANELARFTDELGIDVREAIDVSNTQPFCDIHDPGPGVGGHCIPFYPYFLIQPLESDSQLLETARAVNDSMPAFTVAKVQDVLQKNGTDLDSATVGIMGLTYRPGVEEIQKSPAIPISRELTSLGCTVYGVDPLLDSAEEFELDLVSLEKLYDKSLDALVIVTPHEEFADVRWDLFESPTEEVPFILDGRAFIDDLGVEVPRYTIGSGFKNNNV